MVSGVRGLWAAAAYVSGVLFAGVKFLVFALFRGALFGGAVYVASLHFTAPHSVTRGLVRDKIRDMGRSAATHGTARFANGLELRRLTDRKAGLLVGRDLRSGKLMRYRMNSCGG